MGYEWNPLDHVSVITELELVKASELNAEVPFSRDDREWIHRSIASRKPFQLRVALVFL